MSIYLFFHDNLTVVYLIQSLKPFSFYILTIIQKELVKEKVNTKDYSYLLLQYGSYPAVFAIGNLLTYPVKDLYMIKSSKLEDPNECIITI